MDIMDNPPMDNTANIIIEALENAEASNQNLNELTAEPTIISNYSLVGDSANTTSSTNICQGNFLLLPDDTETCQQPSENNILIDVYHLNKKQNELHQLLISWDLINLYEYLNEQLVYLDELKKLTSEQAYRILKDANFKMNVVINFDYNLRKWQEQSKSTKTTSTVSSLSQITIPTSPSNMSNQSLENNLNVSIFKILNDSAEGRMLLNVYETNKKLNELQRNLLVNIIVEHFIRINLSLSTTTCEQIAEQIVAIMPDEEKEYYYVRRKNASPLGSLYFKYHNRKSRSRKASFCGFHQDGGPPSKKTFILSTNEEEHIQALKHEVLNHEDFMRHWNGSVKARINCIKENTSTANIFEKWPQYKNPMGYRLINVDFSALYEDNKNMINDDFLKMFMIKIVEIYQNQLKDQYCRAILNGMMNSESITDDGKYAAVFYLLHGLLKANPTKTKKFTIRHCQNQFIFLARTVAEFEQYLINNNSPIQPLIGVIGPDILHPEEIIVYFDRMKYKILSIVKAIDIVYKIFHLFNLKYPDAGFAVWQFIQIYFYNFKVSGEVVLPKVVLLKKELSS